MLIKPDIIYPLRSPLNQLSGSNQIVLEKAITLVHKTGLPIAVHSIRSFARHFSHSHYLVIHTDSSIGSMEKEQLLSAAEGITVKLVDFEERWDKLSAYLEQYPVIGQLLTKTGSTLTKLEIPIIEKKPYLFFDSDIIWLQHVANLKPEQAPNAFSTETWSAYAGIAQNSFWIRKKVPRRVNSGIHYLNEPFPMKRLAKLIAGNKFDHTIRYSGDQEIFAFLYRDMEYYHPADFKRSRVGSVYTLSSLQCAAIHFAGRMWKTHIDQIERLSSVSPRRSAAIRFLKPVPLSRFELWRMRVQFKLGDSAVLRPPLNILRKALRPFR